MIKAIFFDRAKAWLKKYRFPLHSWRLERSPTSERDFRYATTGGSITTFAMKNNNENNFLTLGDGGANVFF